MSKPTKSEEELKSDFDSFVEKVLPQAKLVAYSELIGGNYLMKLEQKFNAAGDVVSEKYVNIPWDNEAEVTNALNLLLEGQSNGVGDDFIIISQRQPSHRFWESMMARTIGKPIDQMKVEQNVNMYSETVEAAKQRVKDGGAVPTSISQFM
jgi:hypothetical protein